MHYLSKEILLTDAKSYVEYWDNFIYEDWQETIRSNSRLGIDYKWKKQKIDRELYFPKSNWLIFPKQSWQILPEPYFGNTCIKEGKKIKGLFLNLNPKCSKEQEKGFQIDEFLKTVPYYYKDIYKSGRSYSTLINWILDKFNDNGTYLWMKKHRAEWLSELLNGEKNTIACDEILTMEILPWHSASWGPTEKQYILEHELLSFNKIITPAIFYANYKIPCNELLHSSVICYGADISHLFDKLIKSKIGNIKRVNTSAIVGINNFKCNIFLATSDKIGQTLFFVFQSKGLGVSLPPVSLNQTFDIPGLRLSKRTIIELIVYYKQKCLNL